MMQENLEELTCMKTVEEQLSASPKHDSTMMISKGIHWLLCVSAVLLGIVSGLSIARIIASQQPSSVRALPVEPFTSQPQLRATPTQRRRLKEEENNHLFDLLVHSTVKSMPTMPPIPEYPAATTESQDDGVLRCNGLASSCGVPFNMLAFPAVHSAAASRDRGFETSSRHDRSWEEALKAGFRGLQWTLSQSCKTLSLSFVDVQDFDCQRGSLDAASSLASLKSFLEENKHEVVVLRLDISNNPDLLVRELESLLTRLDLHEMVYPLHDGASWPTMREMIGKNQRIMLFYEGLNMEQAPRTVVPWTPVSDSLSLYASLPDAHRSGQENCYFNLAFQLHALAQRYLEKPPTPWGLPFWVEVDFWHSGQVLRAVQAHNEAMVKRTQRLSAATSD